MNNQNYRDSARYYDLIYYWKDYKKEAEKIKRLIRKYKESPGNDLLEIACGTGGHVRYLQNQFRVLATDSNERMLIVARKNVPGGAFKQADMIHLEVGRPFDVILCLFSSIGYVKTQANLRKTIRNFTRHLKKGGVVIIEPWLTKSIYRSGKSSMDTYSDDAIKIARLTVSKIRGNISLLDMHHLVAVKDKGVKYFVERHELGMFEAEDFFRRMQESGLEARFVKSGFRYDRGLFIGVKR